MVDRPRQVSNFQDINSDKSKCASCFPRSCECASRHRPCRSLAPICAFRHRTRRPVHGCLCNRSIRHIRSDHRTSPRLVASCIRLSRIPQSKLTTLPCHTATSCVRSDLFHSYTRSHPIRFCRASNIDRPRLQVQEHSVGPVRHRQYE